MDTAMFCNQCEQTAMGTACTKVGVCGKDSKTAALQDLLIQQLEGIGWLANELLRKEQPVKPEVVRFVVDGLFSTLTNVNFDPQYFFALLRKSQTVKEALRVQLGATDLPAAVTYQLPGTDLAIENDGYEASFRPMLKKDKDIQSLKDTLLFGLKGTAAYAHHAYNLSYENEEVNHYFFRALSILLDDSLTLNDMVGIVMEFGQVNLKCMELLDTANTTTFGNPEPTVVRVTHRKGPFIIVSGHDLHDLIQLLEQTKEMGIQIYTHGEMLPSLAYPELKKYSHLAGNYGSAWQNQQREFSGIPGCIVMTTNCLMQPKETYRDRIFTTGVVGWADIPHIDAVDGRKDFTPVIEKALELGGWQDDEEEKTILVGFGHAATLSHAGEIIEAVKSGQIKHFYLIGGCDGARPGRNYYTEFAEQTPQDSVIMTLACGKYRFNKQDFGTVAGLPRLLDVGQCNDAYSAIKIAQALAGAFNCGLNDLPLTLVLSWYEQKAVCILLTLLSLGFKNIYLGPTLPAFITPNVLNFLVETFNIMPISTPQADMAAILA